jgi:hypothetical protein
VLKIFRGKLKHIKTINSMQNIKQSGSKTGQLKHHGNPVMGASGGIGLIGGANLFSAGKQILKSGRTAVNLIKNVLKGNKKTTGVIKNASNKPLVVNQSRNLKQQWPSSKFKSGIGARGPLPTSKPVNYSGPNPAHNTGAGGNSYPK